MKRTLLIIIAAIAGLAIFGTGVYFAATKIVRPVLSNMLGSNALAEGYKFNGTGTLNLKVDIDKVKEIPGFPGGEEGDQALAIFDQMTAASIKFDFDGANSGGKSLMNIKLSAGMFMFGDIEASIYSDGKGTWTYSSVPGQEGKWVEDLSDNKDSSPIPKIDIASLIKIRNYVTIKSQDKNSTVFQLKVTSDFIRLFASEEDIKSLEASAGAGTFDDLINGMNIVIEMTTKENVKSITSDFRPAHFKITFDMPFSLLGPILKDQVPPGQMDEESKMMLEAITLKASIDADISYGNVKVEKPEGIN
jgi:hypothetical protein